MGGLIGGGGIISKGSLYVTKVHGPLSSHGSVSDIGPPSI